MRYLLLLGLPLLLAAACGPSAPRVVDPAIASAIWQDVPVPQGAVLTDPSDESPEYSVSGRTVADVMAFYVQRLPEAGWVFDKRSSTLADQPGMGNTRIVVGCRTDGSFVNAAMWPAANGVRLMLQRSSDQLKCPR